MRAGFKFRLRFYVSFQYNHLRKNLEEGAKSLLEGSDLPRTHFMASLAISRHRKINHLWRFPSFLNSATGKTFTTSPASRQTVNQRAQYYREAQHSFLEGTSDSHERISQQIPFEAFNI